MDSRGINLSVQQASNSALSIPVDLSALTCPITRELFFEPVSAAPCGHDVEKRMSHKVAKCPTCREKITSFNAARQTWKILDAVLSMHPELCANVYFDFDHFAEIVRKGELAKATGLRFIRLLQHSKKHLNNKVEEGAQKGKNAIGILSGTTAGRELIRKDEKIRALISKESMQIKVHGKMIEEWLDPESEKYEEEKEEKEYGVSGIGFFAGMNQPQPPDTVWRRSAYGEETHALEMIEADPDLVTRKSTTADYSGRILEDVTPYQIALQAGDEVLAEKIRDIYLEHDPENGQSELDTQWNEVFGQGFDVHLEAQKAEAEAFEHDFINPLVDAITNASPDKLQAALDKQFDNGSELCNQLNAFRAACESRSHHEKVFNPFHLLKAFEKYNEKLDPWSVSRLRLFWRQVIGFEQRYLPANYAQGFCTGLGNLVENKPLKRTFTLHDVDNTGVTRFYPIVSPHGPCSGLGFDFACYSYYEAAGAAVRGGLGRAAWAGGQVRGGVPYGAVSARLFSKIMSNKNREMRKFMPGQSRAIRPRSRCIIQ